MTFPKKDTRKIEINGRTYYWHLNKDFDIKNSWIHVARKDLNGQLLRIDPYPHDFEIRPRMLREAIQFAIKNGWNSNVKSLRVVYDGKKFKVIEE